MFDESENDAPPEPNSALIGNLHMMVFEHTEHPDQHACYLTTDDLMNLTLDPWIEAAACLMSRAARLSNLGFEKTIELITEKAMKYRDGPPPI